MDVAALIIGILALLISVASFAWQLGKHLSTHTVQLQPVESLFNNKKGEPMGHEFAEFDDIPAVEKDLSKPSKT